MMLLNKASLLSLKVSKLQEIKKIAENIGLTDQIMKVYRTGYSNIFESSVKNCVAFIIWHIKTNYLASNAPIEELFEAAIRGVKKAVMQKPNSHITDFAKRVVSEELLAFFQEKGYEFYIINDQEYYKKDNNCSCYEQIYYFVYLIFERKMNPKEISIKLGYKSNYADKLIEQILPKISGKDYRKIKGEQDATSSIESNNIINPINNQLDGLDNLIRLLMNQQEMDRSPLGMDFLITKRQKLMGLVRGYTSDVNTINLLFLWLNSRNEGHSTRQAINYAHFEETVGISIIYAFLKYADSSLLDYITPSGMISDHSK